MKNQAYIFAIFILNGILIGLIFDLFRVFRKSFKTKDWITYFQDIIFWILTALIILYSIFKFNNGELRGFVFGGIGIGLTIYLLIFSNSFIKINLFIINSIKMVFNFIIIKPIIKIIKVLKKFIFKPVSFIVINLSKTLSNLKAKLKNLNNKTKKTQI